MISNAVPPLALALAAAAASRLRLEELEPALREAFVPAIAAMDEADRHYRYTVDATLPAESAGSILAAMADFRDRVRTIRAQTRGEINDIYRRYGRAYEAFDPLDPYTEPARGFSHADGTRVATIADGARARVDSLRAQINEAVLKHLQPSQVDALVAAKRARRDAFERALKAVLDTAVPPNPDVSASDIDKALYQLTQLADGWY